MPRNGSGVYTLPAGNPVEAGTLIEASWANSTLEDLGNEITDSLSRTGEGGMLAPFRLADGTLGAPGVAWLNEPSTGFYRAGTGEMWGVVQGAQILQYTANGILIPSGKTLTAQGNVTVGGTLSVTGALSLSGNVAVGGTFSVTGATTLSSTLAVTGAITATGGVVGNVTGNLTGNVTGNVSGNAGTVTNGVYTTGDQTIAGIKTFSSTIVGSVSGNAGTVTNGVYTTGDQTIGGTKTFSSTISGSITGNAGTVTNGVYTSGSYADPSWLVSIAGSKVTGNISGNAANVTGTVAVANGGTGATTAANARVNLLPSYSGNALKFLRLNAGGTDVEWATEPSVGTVTSVDASGGSTGLSFTGGPITSSGTLTLGGTLALASGGTGATTAAGARTALGLGTIATQNANSVSLTGGAIDGVTIGGSTAAVGSFTTLNASTAANLTVLTSTGLTKLGASTGSESLRVAATTSAVNYVRVYGGATGSAAVIDAQGSDTNVDLSLAAKGAGNINLFNNTVFNTGTANGVAYLNGSKVLTTGSALTFDGTNFGIGISTIPTVGSTTVLAVGAASGGTQAITQSGSIVYRTSASTSGVDFFNPNSSPMQWYTAGTSRMVLDASGRFGVGLSNPQQAIQTNGRVRVSSDNANGGDIGIDGGGLAISSLGATPIIFSRNNFGNESARIDSSGDLQYGRTGGTAAGVVVFGQTSTPGYGRINFYKTLSGTGTACEFNYNGSGVGSIQYTNTATSYNTSSDHRLKEDIQPMTGALAKVAALKPVTYKWKADGSDGQGFIAHELQAVVPECVTGEKDAVDADGKPIYQGIDTSFLVATLTAAIQEQQAIIEQLKADVAALTGA